MDTEFRRLQLKCLEILDVVDKICREHNIKYSLCGGNVVGAHLYKGFLPWDDDIDVMMTRENYNEFLRVAPSCLPDGYSIRNYDTDEKLTARLKISFTKVMLDNTTIVEQDGGISGIFLDLTVYDKIPDNFFLKHIDLFLYKRSQMVNMGKMPGKSIKNRLRNIVLDTLFRNRRGYLLFFQRVVEFFGRHTKKYTYRELFGAYYFANMIPYRPSVFEHYTTIEFEGKQYMIVRDYIEYLQTRYDRTDFREPKEKQVPHHYQYLDFNLPFKEYLLQHGYDISH